MNSTPPPVMALVGDRNGAVTAHRAIPRALELAAAANQTPVTWQWLPAEQVLAPAARLVDFAGVWLVPASLYRSFDGALAAVRFARELRVPFLGTCGGFQHALIEFARNVAGMPEADHAETGRSAPVPVITPLACSLIEVTAPAHFTPGSRLHSILPHRS